MEPGPQDELLSPTSIFRSALLPHTLEVSYGAPEENVVPTTYIESWRGDVRMMILDSPLLPVSIVAGMGQPIVIVGCQTGLLQYWIIPEG